MMTAMKTTQEILRETGVSSEKYVFGFDFGKIIEGNVE